MRGSPIRKPSDHSSFASSPRLIAGYHVLLRLLVPRHPPCALKNFNKNNKTAENQEPHPKGCVLIFTKMLASTVQFSNNQRPRPPPDPPTPPPTGDRAVRDPRTGPYQAPHQPVAGDLRTQQCARQAPSPPPAMFHHHPTRPRRTRQGRRVLTPAKTRTLFRQCSTHEQPPITRAAMAWHLNHPPTSEHRRGGGW